MAGSSSISRSALSAVSAGSIVSSLLTVQTPGRGFIDLSADVAQFVSAGHRTTAFVSVDGRLAGTIEFADRLRHQVPSLMQRLAVLGVTETVMLTGDREASAIRARCGMAVAWR